MSSHRLSNYVTTGYKKVIEMLIKKGADVNAVDSEKMTPLHYVAAMDNDFGGHEDWTEDDSISNFDFTT